MASDLEVMQKAATAAEGKRRTRELLAGGAPPTEDVKGKLALVGEVVSRETDSTGMVWVKRRTMNGYISTLERPTLRLPAAATMRADGDGQTVFVDDEGGKWRLKERAGGGATVEAVEEEESPVGVLTKVKVGETELEVREDGRLWERTMGLVCADVPIDPVRVRELAGTGHKGKKKPAAALVSYDKSYIPPREVLRAWAVQLLEVDREACALVGRNDEDKEMPWMALVPLQESSGAFFEIKDAEPMVLWLLEKGYRMVGTLHTHPGDSTTASVTDEKAWEAFPGLHFIIGRQGSVALWVVAGGATFDAGWRAQVSVKAKGARVERWPLFTQGGGSLADTVGYKTYSSAASGPAKFPWWEEGRGRTRAAGTGQYTKGEVNRDVTEGQQGKFEKARRAASEALREMYICATGGSESEMAVKCAQACLRHVKGGV